MTVWEWETRQEWGAKPPRNRRTDVAPSGVAVHYPGGGKYTGVPHSQCRARMRSWQNMHMARGSNDLEYGLVLCEHLRLMEARIERDRPRVRVGSNGTTDANYRYSSVQLMRGADDPKPTDDEVRGIAEAIAWLRKHGGWGPRITGHRDHTSTACPGNALYGRLDDIRRMVNEIENPTEEDVVKAFRDYTGKPEEPVTIPGDGEWHNIGGLKLQGAPFAAAHEVKELYLRCHPTYSGAGGIVTVRYLRDNDDPTAYLEEELTADNKSLPISRVHMEVGEKALGGRWQMRIQGGIESVQITTRYAKLHALDVDWL